MPDGRRPRPTALSTSSASRPDSAVVAILRDGHVVIPQPETVFAPHDEVVALCSPGSEAGLRSAVVGEDAPGGTPRGDLSSTSENETRPTRWLAVAGGA